MDTIADNAQPIRFYRPNYHVRTPNMRSPDYVQMSTAAAITLGLIPGKMHRTSCTHCTTLNAYIAPTLILSILAFAAKALPRDRPMPPCSLRRGTAALFNPAQPPAAPWEAQRSAESEHLTGSSWFAPAIC